MNNYKTISEIIDLWRLDKKQFVKKSTYSAYMLLLEKHIEPAFGSMYKLEEVDVQAFALKKMALGLCQKSVKDILIVLKMVLKFGAKHKWIKYTAFDIQYPTERMKSEVDVLTRSNQKKVMRYVQAHMTFRNLGIYICLSTGIRIGEVCALMWDDIDTENGLIKIRRTIQRIYTIDQGMRKTELVLDVPKTKFSRRDIPMSNELIKILKPLKKIMNQQFYVLSNDAKPIEPRTYRAYHYKLMQDLQIPTIKFHGLRHSFATRCIESKCDYKTVSVLLGHSNISTTLNLYVHPNMEQKKKCIQQMFKTIN